MRLLQLLANGEISLARDLIEHVPPYAILSHTWGSDEEEVTFSDLKTDAGRTKAGFQKIRFCGEQAARDGLHYFWVDTCCIDKVEQYGAGGSYQLHVSLVSECSSMLRMACGCPQITYSTMGRGIPKEQVVHPRVDSSGANCTFISRIFLSAGETW